MIESRYSSVDIVKQLMYKVYALMAGALTITASVAYYIAHQPILMQKLMHNSWLLFGLFLLQLLIVVILSAAILRLSFAMALAMLTVYSFLMGITLSSIFLIYTMHSIYIAVFVSAAMFASMALYGYFTKTDLTSMGKYAFMALIGLVIGFLANMFFKSGSFDYFLTVIGVLIFTALTAYDVQKIKKMGYFLADQGHAENSIAVLGALTLYLDFINLFLMILRLAGRRNNN